MLANDALRFVGRDEPGVWDLHKVLAIALRRDALKLARGEAVGTGLPALMMGPPLTRYGMNPGLLEVSALSFSATFNPSNILPCNSHSVSR